jgi:hypothetical protein
MNVPVALLRHLEFIHAKKIGPAIAHVPAAEFEQFAGSTIAPDHKRSPEQDRIQWLPTILFTLQCAKVGAESADLVVPIWLHPDISAQPLIPAKALASFVPALIGSEGYRTISAQELLAAYDQNPSDLDLASMTDESRHERR